MKRVIKTLSFAIIASVLLAPVALFAQKDDKEKEKELKEKEKKDGEQIIITRKGNNDGKTVIEINGDKITVNGKPIDELKDGDITVHRSRVKDFWAFDGDRFKSFNGNLAMVNVDENRAMLGVTTDKADNGAEIQSITKEGGAEKAGLKKGDIITKLGDSKIEDPDDLTEAIRSRKPGDKVDITYLRDKKEQKVTAELGKWKGVGAYSLGRGQQNYGFTMPDMNFDYLTPRGQVSPRISWSGGGGPKLGISVQDTDDGKGVKVIDVDEDGNGAKAGIKEDDVITFVDGKAVNGADEIAKIIRESKDKVSVKVQLQRNGKTENVDVKIPRRLKSADL